MSLNGGKLPIAKITMVYVGLSGVSMPPMIGRPIKKSRSHAGCPLNRSAPCSHNRELAVPLTNTPHSGHLSARANAFVNGSQKLTPV